MYSTCSIWSKNSRITNLPNDRAEICSLHKLVTAQMKMAAYQFFDSTLLIYSVKQELDSWKLKFNSLDQVRSIKI